MTARECSIDGCDRQHYARGWCQMHYLRWRSNGDPHIVRALHGADLETLTRRWFTQGHPHECWPWRGRSISQGYGQLRHDGKTHKAYRLVYELLVGPIPQGLEIDHICRNRICVNPTHLEPVTKHENWRRSDCPTAVNARKTHCPAGHAYDDVNARTYRGFRYCRACERARSTARRARRRSAA